jgi:hypothetical protein
MSKVFVVNESFSPESSKRGIYVYLLEDNYELEKGELEDGIRIIHRRTNVSVFVSNAEVAKYGEVIEAMPQVVESSNHTLPEVAKLLEDSTAGIILHPRSAKKVAEWLKELQDSRNAIDDARIALAKARR